MDPNSSLVEIFFFPFVGGGHQIPMIDVARVFASHGAKSTIIATQNHSQSFQQSILRDQIAGRKISIHVLDLPENIDIADTDMSAAPFTDTSMLEQPLINLLLGKKPDCIVHDVFHRWSASAIDTTGIPRITFNGNGCFARCVQENLGRFKPHENVDLSDLDPFVVPGIPDRIELTRSQLPMFNRPRNGEFHKPRHMHKPKEKSFGVVINSFYELEPAYVEYLKKELENEAWLVGPVSLCNRNIEDKAERGKKSTIDQWSILSWLESKGNDSVVYASFGSLSRVAPEQVLEIAYGLEASNHPFVWVVGNILKSNGEEQDWLPSGFEDRVGESGMGLIINGWAPQLLILEHKAVGGFMTHCGWNSTLEGVSCGLPMITWPMGAEQFTNEKLVTDVLKIGVKVGNIHWQSFNTEKKVIIGREKVEKAVRTLMAGGEEAAEMRRRAKELGLKAKKAVQEGGSSYRETENLIQKLKYRRRNSAS